MANVVYVGNYPSTFTDDDIINIFNDFEGLVLLRSVKKNQKCYSFILCADQEQVLDVVLTLNETEAGGRTLIVRASDDELQEIIEEIEDEEYDESQLSEQLDDYCSYSTASDNSVYRQPQKKSYIASQFEERNDTKNGGCSLNSRPDSRHFKRPGLSLNNVKNHEVLHSQDFETASCASFATSRRSGRLSPGSTTSQFSKTDRRGERFSFVSAINFRNGTTVEELEDLFADYNPYKIIMRFHTSTKGQPTEAIVCFLKSKHAYDAILNLDNTVLNGRVLLVSECDDISYIQDLIRVHNIH